MDLKTILAYEIRVLNGKQNFIFIRMQHENYNKMLFVKFQFALYSQQNSRKKINRLFRFIFTQHTGYNFSIAIPIPSDY